MCQAVFWHWRYTHDRNILVNGDFSSPFSAHEEEVNKGYVFRPKRHHKRDLTHTCPIMSLKTFFFKL